MNVKEKLIELISKAKAMYADDYTDHTEEEYIAETIWDNLIVVWDGKPIGAFLHPIDAYKGLKAKYLVFTDDPGEMADNCFILRPDKDAAAVEALRAYAKATDNVTLAKDIYNWVGKGKSVQEWISVKDRLPEYDQVVLCYKDDRGVRIGKNMSATYADGVVAFKDLERDYAFGATHWMPLPEPPTTEVSK